MGNLHTEAVLIRFSCDLFRRSTTDKKATEQTHKSNKAEADAGKYVKALFNPAALKPFERVIAAARAVIDKETVPWDGNGSHLLAVTKFQDFDAQMHKLRQEFEGVREEFIKHYQSHIDESKTRLGKLFNADNYPSEWELRADCQFNHRYLPVPTYEDIRIQDTGIADKMVEAIGAAYAGLITTLADDLYDEVKAAHDQLDQGERFRSERVDRLTELVKKIRTYNLTGDPRVETALMTVETGVIAELNTFIDARSKRSATKDDKDAAREAAKARIHDAALKMAGLFT